MNTSKRAAILIVALFTIMLTACGGTGIYVSELNDNMADMADEFDQVSPWLEMLAKNPGWNAPDGYSRASTRYWVVVLNSCSTIADTGPPPKKAAALYQEAMLMCGDLKHMTEYMGEVYDVQSGKTQKETIRLLFDSMGKATSHINKYTGLLELYYINN